MALHVAAALDLPTKKVTTFHSWKVLTGQA